MADDSGKSAESLLAVVNDAARGVGGRFVTFLTVGVYIAVTVAATTDEMLVHAKPVILPLLNAPIPISGWFGFYSIAPWLIVLLHWDLLLQLSTLRDKLTLFRAAAAQVPEDQQVLLRERVSSFYYVEFLLGRQAPGFPYVLSSLIIWLSVIVLPLLLLLLMQIRFLRFHSEELTMLQQVTVGIDVVLIFALWPQLSALDDQTLSRAARWRARVSFPVTGVVCVLAVLFSFAVARVPDDQRDTHDASWLQWSANNAWPASWRRWWFELRNLNLREQDLTRTELSAESINRLRDGDPSERDAELGKVSPLAFLQGRDLRAANLFGAVLPKLDLRSEQLANGEMIVTRLGGANLQWAQMQGALLDGADMQQARLGQASAQGASMQGTVLVSADLNGAHLEEASMQNAALQSASLVKAYLQGADLAGARLEGALLVEAHLQGATLRESDLRSADLTRADLRGADLTGAHLEGARLTGARLEGALLRNAFVLGADFQGVDLAQSDRTGAVDALGTDSRFEAVCRGSCDAWPAPFPLASDGAVVGDGRLAGYLCMHADHVLDLPTAGRASGAGPLPRSAAVDRPTRPTCLLLDIACDDPYAARGLSRQAVDATEQDAPRNGLAALLQAAANGDKTCRGMLLLRPAARLALTGVVGRHPPAGVETVCNRTEPVAGPLRARARESVRAPRPQDIVARASILPKP